MVKKLPCLEELLRDRPAEPPYEGAKDHYLLDPDDRDTPGGHHNSVEQLRRLVKDGGVLFPHPYRGAAPVGEKRRKDQCYADFGTEKYLLRCSHLRPRQTVKSAVVPPTSSIRAAGASSTWKPIFPADRGGHPPAQEADPKEKGDRFGGGACALGYRLAAADEAGPV